MIRSTAVALLVSFPILSAASTLPVLAPIFVHIEAPHAVGRCADPSEMRLLSQKLPALIAATGSFVASDTASVPLRLGVDTLSFSGGQRCRLGANLESGDEVFEAHHLLDTSERSGDLAAWQRLFADLAKQYLSRHATRLSVVTKPSGLRVQVGGADAGLSPLQLERLRPGNIVVQIFGEGWNPVAETLSLEPGAQLRRDYALTRSQTWLDSVHRAEVAHRRDSIWTTARNTPSQALPELFARLGRIPLPAGRQSVAVLPFQVTGKASGYDPGVMAAEYGVAYFSKDPRFTVVEREGVNRLLKEQALAQSGAVSDSGAAVAGRLVAARYLVTGTVTVNGRVQTFAARLVDVETGEIVSASVASVGSDGLEELYRTAIGERGQLSGSLYRSAVGPGWGQFYTGHPVHGGLFLGATVASLGFIGWSYADFLSKDDDYKKYRNHDIATVTGNETSDAWIAAAEHTRTKRNDAATQVNISLAVLGGVWIANLVDAGILGYQESRRIKAEYFTWSPNDVSLVPGGAVLSWRF